MTRNHLPGNAAPDGNAGSGLAVLHGWRVAPDRLRPGPRDAPLRFDGPAG